jgi:hypothetical protein
MAYALVVWRRDGDMDEVEQAFAGIPSIPLFRGFFLIREDGAAFDAVRQQIQGVVEAHSGTEAVIVMPSKGTRVSGWVHNTPTAAALQEARNIMNRSGSTAVPELLATPPVP